MKRQVKRGTITRSTKSAAYNLLEGVPLYTVNMYGEDGKFTPAVSAVPLGLPACPQAPSKGYYSEGNGALFVYANGTVSRLNKGAASFVTMEQNLSENCFFTDMYLNGFSAAVLFDGADQYVFLGALQEDTTCAHSFYAGAWHCGRFFARDLNDGFRIWWAASDSVDWTEGINGCGYTYLPAEGGEVLRLFSFRERLVAVRRRGITVIHAYGEPQHYKVDATANYLVADGVIGETCAMCAGGIVFCTESGIYLFNGSSLERIFLFNGGRVSSPARAAACGERYCFVCDDVHLGGGVLAVLDVPSGRLAVTDITPGAVFAGKDGVYVSVGTALCKIEDGGTGELYLPSFLPENSPRAHIKSICVQCSGGCTVALSSNGVQRAFSGSGRHRVGMGGHNFSFAVQAEGSLSRLTAQAEV